MKKVNERIYPVFNRMRELIFNGYIYRNAIRGNHDPIKVIGTLVEGDFYDTLCFPDINYSDDCRSLWDAERHYGRLKQALIADNGKLLHSDECFRARILKALRYWVKHDFKNPNWWHNEIGVPRNLADITLILYEYLPEDLFYPLISIISRGSAFGENGEKVRRWSGANKIWGAATTLRHAVLIGDENILQEAVLMAASELDYNFEGIHRDGSFFQHGARLYSGGYGRSFASDMAQFTYILQGTEWQFSLEKLNILALHILDGLRNMTQFKALDYACVGREFTRPGFLSTESIKSVVSLLLKTTEMPRKDDFADYLAELSGEKEFNGTKYFNEAALLSHHVNGLYIGARFLYGNLVDAEICNDEGILCYNMSYGTHTCAMVDGSEYFNISPIWQYDKIPGTTAAAEADEILVKYKWLNNTLPDGIGGGMQGHNCGIIFEKAEHDGITVYASAYAVPEGMVFLGSGISTEKIRPLYTTVEQSNWQEDIRYEGDSVIHHGIRYTPLCGTKFHVETKEVEGSWRRNSLPESPEIIKGKLFTVTVEHLSSMVCGDKKSSYAYDISSVATELPKIEILQNDERVQSIRIGDGTVMSVYFDSAKCEITK